MRHTILRLPLSLSLSLALSLALPLVGALGACGKSQPAATQAAPSGGGDQVIFNTESKKFHKPSCNTVSGCKHCTKTSRGDAIKQGGEPCKVCGG